MNIALKPDQQKWLEEQVASGTFASVEEAVSLAVAELMTGPEEDDITCAESQIDEAHNDIPAGDEKTEIEAQLGQDVRPDSWLSALAKRIRDKIPAEEWAKMPERSSNDIDRKIFRR